MYINDLFLTGVIVYPDIIPSWQNPFHWKGIMSEKCKNLKVVLSEVCKSEPSWTKDNKYGVGEFWLWCMVYIVTDGNYSRINRTWVLTIVI